MLKCGCVTDSIYDNESESKWVCLPSQQHQQTPWTWLFVLQKCSKVYILYIGQLKEIIMLSAAVIPLSRRIKWNWWVKLPESFLQSFCRNPLQKEPLTSLLCVLYIKPPADFVGISVFPLPEFRQQGDVLILWSLDSDLDPNPRTLFSAKLFCHCAQSLLEKLFPPDNSKQRIV